MKWSDEYATGAEEIDGQHKMIFQMAEDFRAALDEGRGEGVYEGLLRSLDLYVRTHFTYEEACMTRYLCPAAQANAEAHGRFVETLTLFKQSYARNGFDRADARNLVDTLDHWMANHIARVDVKLKGYVQGVPE